MGDLLYSRALRTLVKIRDMEIMRILTDVSNELAIGEMRQLGAIDRLGFTEDEYFKLIRAKTASLLAAACETGAMCGAPAHSRAMARYGDRLGMAFQIADDILDYLGDESVTGKPAGLDLKEHKVTLPMIAALPRLTAARTPRSPITALPPSWPHRFVGSPSVRSVASCPTLRCPRISRFRRPDCGFQQLNKARFWCLFRCSGQGPGTA